MCALVPVWRHGSSWNHNSELFNMADSFENKRADPSHIENQSSGMILPDSTDAEYAGTDKEASPVVDKALERKLLRKLDLRIVPMIMWM